MGKYFGTDGVRGKANETLKVEIAYKIGRFLGFYYSKNKKAKIVIGKDTRLSSSMFESALASGISASGADAYLIGYCSTPCLAYVNQSGDFDCGVMISASHNPYTDNGIKIFFSDGLKANDELLNPLEDYIDDKFTIPYANSDLIGSILTYEKGIKDYQNWLKELYPLDLSKYHICVDLCNGSNCYIAKDVFRDLNCNVTYINDCPNGININNNCGSTHLDNLSLNVKEGNFDLGLAFDGDADRVLFVDHLGNTIDGDKIMYLLSKYFKDHNQLKDNKLVTTVMSNIGLFKALDKENIGYEVTAVGDKNVAECMSKYGYVVGGEQSGHIIIKYDSIFGDGLKTALAILRAISYYDNSLKECTDAVWVYPQLLVNERVKDKTVVLNDEDIKKLIKEIGETLGNDGRILVRPSGTEPLIRVMVEAETSELCHKYVYQVIDLIKEKQY